MVFGTVVENMNSTANKKLIVSKKRVADHGEVFTDQREVQAMLDLVQQETERIDSRFLEPACGNGNFLAEILKRKLRMVDQRKLYKKYGLTEDEIAFFDSKICPMEANGE